MEKLKISLTEELWDTLNPEPKDDLGEEFGTAWMFSDDFYITIWKAQKGKVFGLHHPNLEMPVVFIIDSMFHTAGDLTITSNLIKIEHLDNSSILFEQSNVVPFRH